MISRFFKFFEKKSQEANVLFDENGKVYRIEVLPVNWTLNVQGEYKYYRAKTKTLLRASEVLKGLEIIPPFTYYIVETPFGSLGRDIDGFFTEGPLKIDGVGFIQNSVDEIIDCENLGGFGNDFNNIQTIAYLKSQGRYASLVMLMKCGKCGYESPVETLEGDFIRECYCCGTKNKCSRGAVRVIIRSREITI